MGDKKGLSEWTRAKREEMEISSEDMKRLVAYIDSLDKSRAEGLNRARRKRRGAIRKRLKALGWKDEDMEFSGREAKPWNSLVEISKPLTDRSWKTILPQLVSLLKANRALHIAEAKEARRAERVERVHELLSKIKRDTHPFQAVRDALKPNLPPNSDLAPKRDAVSKCDPESRCSFPRTGTALKWECLRKLEGWDVGLELVQVFFGRRREEVEGKISKWREGIEKRLVEIFEAGGEDKPRIDGEDAQDDVVVKVNGNTDSTSRLSRNARLLLRADTIFQKHRPTTSVSSFSRSPGPLFYYPDLVTPHISSLDKETDRNAETDLNLFSRYTEAEQIAKVLLKDLGMPDVALAELQMLERRLACGRCDRGVMTWQGTVEHYIAESWHWEEQKEPSGKHSTRHPVVYRYTHDLEPGAVPKPLVRILTVEEALAKDAIPSVQANHRYHCWLCHHTGRGQRAGIDELRVHMRDVHEVMNPTEGLYYGKKERANAPEDEWHNTWDAYHDAQLGLSVLGSEVPFSLF